MLPPGYPTSKKFTTLGQGTYIRITCYIIYLILQSRSFIFVFNQVWTLWFKKISLSNVASSMVLLHIFDEIVSPEIRELQRSIISLNMRYFHSIFYCVHVLYTTNKQTSLFRDISGSFWYKTKNLPKKYWIHLCFVSYLKLDYFLL